MVKKIQNHCNTKHQIIQFACIVFEDCKVVMNPIRIDLLILYMS